MTLTTGKDAVLAAINDLRAELELPPLDAIPCGSQGSPDDCPVAKALSRPGEQARVGRTRWRRTAQQSGQPLPSVLCEFTRAFDFGDYPELIEVRAA